MKKKSKLISAAVTLLIVVLASQALAAGNEAMIKRNFERQQRGIKKTITSFLNGESEKALSSGVLDILSAEANLMAYGVNPEDKRIVGKFAQGGGGQANFRRYGYRLLCHQFKTRTGWQPMSGRSLSQREFFLQSKKGKVAFTIRTR